MSHNIHVKDIKINDVSALEAAVAELAASGVKIRLEHDAVCRGYGSSKTKHPIVIKLDDSPYDIGFNQDDEGNYVPMFDPWGGHIAKSVGYDKRELNAEHCDLNSPGVTLGRLNQYYIANKIEREAAQQGRTVRRDGIDEKTKMFNMVVSY